MPVTFARRSSAADSAASSAPAVDGNYGAETPVRSQPLSAFAALALVMAAALAVVAPFFWKGTASGHDIAFHITSWMDAAGQWREGILYPRWAEWANYGFGEARFIFYPPLSWMLGAALGSILPWKAVAGTMIWLILTLAGATMYRLARVWMPPRYAALAAVLFAVNPYHMVVAYFRSDYAELLASALFPLVLLYTLCLSRAAGAAAAPLVPGRAPWRLYAGSVVPLAIVFAAVWLSNAPAAVIVTYSLTVLLTVLAVLRRSFAVLVAGGTAIALGLLLAGFYILPAINEQRWVKISEVLSGGLRHEQNFLFTRIDDAEHNAFNLLVSTVATAMIAITGIAALAARWPNRQGREEERTVWWALLALAAAATVLVLPWSAPAWRWLPQLRYVQFPWRWLFPLSAASAFFVAAAIRRTRARVAGTLLAAMALVLAGNSLVHRTWWDTRDALVAEAAIRQGHGYEGTDEYDTVGTDHYDLPRNAPRLVILPAKNAEEANAAARSSAAPHAALRVAPKIHIEKWGAETKVFTVQSAESVTVALRLLTYPAWRVAVNGEEVDPDAQEGTGQMLLQLDPGHRRVRIHFSRTPDRTLGAAVSLAATLALLALTWAGRHRSNSAQLTSGAGLQERV